MAVSGTALGQEESGGPRLTFGVTSGLRYATNPDLDSPAEGGGVVSETSLDFGYRDATRVQRLALDLSGTLRLAGEDSTLDDGLRSPRLAFSYAREGARSRIELSASYQTTDLGRLSLDDPLLVLDPETGEVVVSTDAGEATTAVVALDFETGIDRPLGLEANLRHSERDYDSPDPDLSDSRTDSATVALRFDLSPVLTSRLRLGTTRYEADDAEETRRRTDRAALSVDYELDEITQIGASLGTSRVVTEETTGTTTRRGLTAGLSVQRALPRGSVGLSYDRTITTNGARDTLRLDRAFEMKGGTLSVSVGASRGEDGEIAAVGDVDYALELKRSALNLGLTREVRTDDDNNDVLTTRLSAGIDRELTALSSLSLDMGYVRVEDGGAGTSDTADQTDLTVTYQHRVTRDWSLAGGYEYSNVHESAGTDAEDHALFLNLGRTLSIRP